jgi:trimeric autotransporter adhesin
MRSFSQFLAIAVSTLLLVSICSAQQISPTPPANSERQGSPTPPPGPVLGGDGIPYYIPLWRTNNYLLSSVIFQNGSNIGIGTTTPAATLDVNGGINTAQNYQIGGASVLNIGRLSDNNLFLGVGAGASNVAGDGQSNTFSGYQAGYNNTLGATNTFSGSFAGSSNTYGNANTFFGYSAGPYNTSGSYNTFSGYGVGTSNTTGYENAFYGAAAGISNSTGSNNTFVGTAAGAGEPNHSGSYNTFLGAGAGGSGSNGNYNTMIGAGAAPINTETGSNNVYINTPGDTSGTESNTIRIGDPTVQTAAYIAGIYGSTSSSGIPVYINTNGLLGTQTSSLRFKEHISDMGDSTKALMKLRPVTYLYKAEYSKGERTLQYGLIAEEVAKVYPELVAYDTEGQPYSVRYQYIAIMLLNEVQKQYRRAETQAEIIKEQEQKIDDLEQRLSRLEKMVTNQVQTVAQK